MPTLRTRCWGKFSQNRFKAWATGKPNLAWYLEQRNVEEDWRKPMIDGWAAVSALLTIQGYLDVCWVTSPDEDLSTPAVQIQERLGPVTTSSTHIPKVGAGKIPGTEAALDDPGSMARLMSGRLGDHVAVNES